MILKNLVDSQNFAINEYYICLGIEFSEYHKSTLVSVRRDSDGTPVQMPLSDFKIIEHDIPLGCSINFFDGGFTRVQPTIFSGNFWDLYYEGDPHSEKKFEEYYEILCNFFNIKNKFK